MAFSTETAIHQVPGRLQEGKQEATHTHIQTSCALLFAGFIPAGEDIGAPDDIIAGGRSPTADRAGRLQDF